MTFAEIISRQDLKDLIGNVYVPSAGEIVCLIDQILINLFSESNILIIILNSIVFPFMRLPETWWSRDMKICLHISLY